MAKVTALKNVSSESRVSFRVVDLLRSIAWKSSTIPVFGRLVGLPYQIAISRFRQTVARDPDILSVYVRNTAANRQLAPGLSDIDFTVVVRDQTLSNPRKTALRIHRRTARLRRLFPVVGDLELVPCCYLNARRSRAIFGYESKDWKLLCGEELRESELKESE